MTKPRILIAVISAVFIAFSLESSVFAQMPIDNVALANVETDGAGVSWRISVPFTSVVLVVSAPGGVVSRKEFTANATPTFSASSLGAAALPDGQYNFELRIKASSSGSSNLRTRQFGDADAAGSPDKPAVPATSALVQFGSFAVQSGRIFVGAPGEGVETTRAKGIGKFSATSRDSIPAPNDVVTADDAIIQGSACIGLDCVNNESFGFDTVRLKENNTRIAFVDTSTGTGFPTRDWRIRANDSASGGRNAFFIDDMGDTSTGSDSPVFTPFTILSGAPDNSFVIDSIGRIGLRTSTPALDIHVVTPNTPAIRLDQSNSGGFTPQTWDIGANEANFFVRDVTGGSKLPFRIRPGAPTSSIDIGADGAVSFAKGIKLPPLDNNGVPTGQPVDQTALLSPLGPNYATHVMGALGIVDEDSTAIVNLDNTTGVGVKSGSAGTVTIRYNINPNSNFFAAGSVSSTFKIRFRDSDGSGAGARVRVFIHQTDIDTGVDSRSPIFDSNSQASTGTGFTTAMLCFPTGGLAQSFASQSLWIEVQVTNTNTGALGDFSQMQIYRGLTCP